MKIPDISALNPAIKLIERLIDSGMIWLILFGIFIFGIILFFLI